MVAKCVHTRFGIRRELNDSVMRFVSIRCAQRSDVRQVQQGKKQTQSECACVSSCSDLLQLLLVLSPEQTAHTTWTDATISYQPCNTGADRI